MGDVVADRAAQHRIPGLERVEHRLLRDLARQIDVDFVVHLRERSKMCWQYDANHAAPPLRRGGSVWTSTDSTAGRSRTTGAQLSPPLVDAYTCPPVVPKYTPHDSSESAAIASRNTFT